jgi:UDP-N-acetylmuramoyl-L-alanyl-D-glutamate--2,6-diaminopimelate ligase
MGRVAAEGSDVVILTSDNPRSEDPREILRQIEAGVRETACRPFDASGERVPQGMGLYAVVEDRRTAIRLAVQAAGPADTVLICGKGHETHQIVGDTVRHFDDREEAAAALREMADGPSS